MTKKSKTPKSVHVQPLFVFVGVSLWFKGGGELTLEMWNQEYVITKSDCDSI